MAEFPLQRRSGESEVAYAARLFHRGERDDRRHSERADRMLGPILAGFSPREMDDYLRGTSGT